MRYLKIILILPVLFVMSAQGVFGAGQTLVKNTIMADGHPMALWEKTVDNPKGLILLHHGRTWSSLPDFDLQVDGE